MADNYVEYDATPTEFTLTNLHSLAAGNIWVSNAITQTPGTCKTGVVISYYLHCNASVVDGEAFYFRILRGDDHGTEIRDADVSNSEQELSAADDIDDVQDAAAPLHVAPIDRASQDVKGSFMIEDPGPDWQLAIEFDTSAGALEAEGSSVRYRYIQDGDGS